MGYIYLIRRDNVPVYVGQTIKTIEERFEEHIRAANSKKAPHFALHNAINKYGISHFSVEQLEKIENLDERECYWIKALHTLCTEGGYNLTKGGDYRPEYVQCKCYQYDLNGKFIKEFPSISEASRSIGKPHANITKVLNGQINVAYGYRWSKEKCDILPFKKTNYTGSPKRIAQYSLDGKLVKIYSSTKEAAKEINYSSGTLSMAATGKRKTAKGFI